MSDIRTGFVLGFHGCDAEVAERIFQGEPMQPSAKSYDWLGPGAYFWEGDPKRAWEWAKDREKWGKIKTASVVGAVIDLGNCLDLTKRSDCQLLASAYQSMADGFAKMGRSLPVNQDPKNVEPGDKVLRYLDCAVIEHLHENIDAEAQEEEAAGRVPAVPRFDTVRGLFTEGGPLYTNGGFYTLTHTQIAVRSDRSIIGYFRTR